MKSITRIETAGVRIPAAKIKVAAYCRVSTGSEEQMISLEAQKKHYEEKINANPAYVFAGLYYDEGITGTKKEVRPALMQLIKDCEAGRIDRVETKSLSRFARNTTDCLELIRKLNDLGISVFFEKENIDTGSMESELLLSIMSSLAENESVSISENSKWGVRHRFENGTFKIGYAPYGYSIEDGIFTVKEEEAVWVRWIFAQALEGKASNAIARELNAKKVPSRRTGHWTGTTVREMLRNEKYIGDCLFQKTYSDFRFVRHKNHGNLDQFYMEDHHEAIISRDDFKAVQQVIRQRAKEKNVKKNDSRYQSRYPFTGKLRCGRCGSVLKRKICYTGNVRYAAWACQEHLKSASSCTAKALREDVLQNAFTTMMNKLVFAGKDILMDLIASTRQETHDDSHYRISEIDKMLEKNSDRQQTLMTIMAKGYLEPALFTQESNDLAAEEERLKEEKRKLVQAVSGNSKTREALHDLLGYVMHAQMATEFDKDQVNRVVKDITVHYQKEVTFHLKCGLNLTERAE